MADQQGSRLPGFFKLDLDARHAALQQAAGLSEEQIETLSGRDGLTIEDADHMIENVVGVFGIPLGIAANFQVNGRDVLVPMAVEEPSVVAGASFMAKLARQGGGFQTEADPPEMIGQIQILDLPDNDLDRAGQALEAEIDSILAAADEIDPVIQKLGGGARALEIRPIESSPVGPMLIAHLIYDTRDAMGANAVNTAVETLAPRIEEITGGRVHLRILSNLADRRLVRAACRIPLDALAFRDFDGAEVRDGVIEAWAFAAVDPYRAATHNKGIMNGIDAVVLATGNDWRAVEAGAHAYAARDGRYTSISRWWADENGDLRGELELPMVAGVVGGATRAHPTAKACLDLMGVETAQELAQVIAAVGLAQNLAALRALATEGIQRGHMRLHARQVAVAAGAEGDAIDRIAKQMVSEGSVRIDRAQSILAENN
ncbi:MAG: hydroxymethylglutaryl-CoA reductase, degradative [Anaerolineales bacterium]